MERSAATTLVWPTNSDHVLGRTKWASGTCFEFEKSESNLMYSQFFFHCHITIVYGFITNITTGITTDE